MTDKIWNANEIKTALDAMRDELNIILGQSKDPNVSGQIQEINQKLDSLASQYAAESFTIMIEKSRLAYVKVREAMTELEACGSGFMRALRADEARWIASSLIHLQQFDELFLHYLHLAHNRASSMNKKPNGK